MISRVAASPWLAAPSLRATSPNPEGPRSANRREFQNEVAGRAFDRAARKPSRARHGGIDCARAVIVLAEMGEMMLLLRPDLLAAFGVVLEPRIRRLRMAQAATAAG